MATDERPAHLRFGRFELQPAQRRLLRDGQPVDLGARAFDLLVVLAGRAGRLVAKEDLLTLAWPNLVVEESNLPVQVSTLRKVLGSEAIATIAGRGYRFTLEVTGDGAARSPKRACHNLPQQLTSFVGRQPALRAIKEALEKSRLLTLVGFGGIGKTRLALQVAAEVSGDYPDGVWFVELAPLTDALLVPQSVASVLGVREAPGHSVMEALSRFMIDRRLLVIIDSCEHLLHACAEFAKRILQAAPHMKILATSRERLNLAGEATCAVSTLALPEAKQAIPLERFTEYEAVRLFVDRAAAALPAFRLTESNAAAVADVCAHVDGIPLAIELAAARLRTMSIGNLAQRLNDRFRLLNRGDPTAAPRQQTMRALIDWSYDLLTERERALLRRLAVFGGGWTLEAAEAVCIGDGVTAEDVLDLLSELADKSLVVVDDRNERYRLLDTVREYAFDRLDETSDGESARAQHVDYYVALAERLMPEERGGDQAAIFNRLDAERDNILAAHARCDRRDDGAELGLRLLHATKMYWINRGGLALGHRLATEVLARVPAHVRTVAHQKGYYSTALLAGSMGRYAEAEDLLHKAVSIARENANDSGTGLSLRLLGIVAYSQGKLPEARTYIEEALVVVRRMGEKMPRVSLLMTLAELDRLERAFDKAEQRFAEALPLARELADLRIIGILLLNLAMVSVTRGFPRRAPAMLLEAQGNFERIGSKGLGGAVLWVTAGVAAAFEEWHPAAKLYGAACARMQELGLQHEPADEAFLMPLMNKAREALGAPAFAAAEAAGRELSDDAAMADSRAWLSDR